MSLYRNKLRAQPHKLQQYIRLLHRKSRTKQTCEEFCLSVSLCIVLTGIRALIHTHTHARARVCVYVCMSVCVCVCVCVRTEAWVYLTPRFWQFESSVCNSTNNILNPSPQYTTRIWRIKKSL